MIYSKFINDSIYQVDIEYVDQSKIPTKISKLYPENIIKLHWNKTTIIKRARVNFLQSEIDEFYQYILKKSLPNSETLDD